MKIISIFLEIKANMIYSYRKSIAASSIINYRWSSYKDFTSNY